MTAFAASLGFDIAITEFAPARADVLRADDPVYDPSWAHAWQIGAVTVQIDYFSADLSYADEPVEYWSNAVLECEMRRLAPAHTSLFFTYGTAGFTADFSAEFTGA